MYKLKPCSTVNNGKITKSTGELIPDFERTIFRVIFIEGIPQAAGDKSP